MESDIDITFYCFNHYTFSQLLESLSPWPASTHSRLPLHWSLHLLAILSFQVNVEVDVYDGDGIDDGVLNNDYDTNALEHLDTDFKDALALAGQLHHSKVHLQDLHWSQRKRRSSSYASQPLSRGGGRC